MNDTTIIDLHKDNYSFDKYIERCCKMDLIEILEDTRREIERLNKINLHSNTYQSYADMIMSYKYYIQEVYEFLNGAPIGIISEWNRERIKPLLQHLRIKPQ